MSGEKGWVIDPNEVGATYYGQWIRVSLFRIEGDTSGEYFFTCAAADLDCFKLKSTKLGEAQYEALMLISKMMKRYGEDVTKALRSRSMDEHQTRG